MCRRPRQPPGWPVAAPRAETSTLHPLHPSQPSAGEGGGGREGEGGEGRGGREGGGGEGRGGEGRGDKAFYITQKSLFWDTFRVSIIIHTVLQLSNM